MALANDELIFAWIDGATPSQIRTASARLTSR